MFRSILAVLLCVLYASLTAQVIGYVDSVEVHRTDTIYFDFGSSELTDASTAAVATLVADRPAELELYLEGHTDAVGSDRANDALAQRRSEATLTAALAAGWPEDAVEIRHFGEQRLLVNSADREWRNRRVLLRSGAPKRYALFRGQVTDEDGKPLPGGVIADSKYLKDTVRADDQGYYVIPLPLDVGVRLDVYAKLAANFWWKTCFLLVTGRSFCSVPAPRCPASFSLCAVVTSCGSRSVATSTCRANAAAPVPGNTAWPKTVRGWYTITCCTSVSNESV